MKRLYTILVAVLAINISFAQQWTNSSIVDNFQVRTKNIQENKSTGINSKMPKYDEAKSLQVPDDINGRLYRLCKVWGYFKYFHQERCTVKWDTLLNTTINQVLLSSSNNDFNNILMEMFNKVGNNSSVANPNPLPDVNLNYNNAWITDTEFSQSVRNFLDIFTTNINPNTSTCFVKYNNYSDLDYTSYIDFRNDPLSMTLSYTHEDDRLTAMFYYWNIINYFFPYKNIMDQSWDSTLLQFIPLIRQASTVNDFHKTFLKLATKINDSHGYTTSTVLTTSFWGGSYLPQIYFTRIGTNCVVTKVRNIAGVKVGDILTSVKGIGIQNIEDSLSKFTPASTPAAMYRDIYSKMLLGTLNSSLNCTFLNSTNSSYSVSLTRTITNYEWSSWTLDNGKTTSYRTTTCGYGYVDMGKLKSSEVSTMYNTLKNTPAIIFDLRNYPNGTLWDLGPLFFQAPIVSASFHRPALTHIPYGYKYMPGWYYDSDDSSNIGSWTNANAYSGKVYILVNQETESQAEYTCQYLSYHPKAKVIGTQTSGADGNTSYVTLPGGISTYFTSLGWYYADGYKQQRNGVRIDSIVTPTIAGLREGHDEILEAALSCQSGIDDLNKTDNNISVYPNPVSNELNIEFEGNSELISFQILNSLGNVVFKGNMTEKVTVPTTSFAPGIYFIKLENRAAFEIRKIVKE